MTDTTQIEPSRLVSAAEQGARPASENGSVLYSPTIGPALRKQRDGVKRTRQYFNSLRGPTYELEQRIESLTRALERANRQNEKLNEAVTKLRAKLFFFEDPATTGRISVQKIMCAVAEYYRLPMTELLSERRTTSIVGPRQIAMYLAKILTTHSYPEIGRQFGGRDHTTILHAIRAVNKRCAANPDVKEVVDTIRNKLLSLPVA